ncbi:MAG: S8 family peptidase [Chloroflexota bacterium]
MASAQLVGAKAVSYEVPDAGAIDAATTTEPFASGRILVKTRNSSPPGQVQSAQSATSLMGLPVVATIQTLDVQVLEVEEGQELEMVTALNAREDVEYAEPDYLVHHMASHKKESIQSTVSPNDSLYSQQWGLSAIHAPEVWAITQGSANVVIAVIDTGIDLGHPDLESELVAGEAFTRRSSTAQDDNGHGTHVASIAAGATNNQLGVAGVAWQARIMPIKALNSRGSGRISDIADGIRWAVDNGADVINMSLGSSEGSNTLLSAVQYAYNNDVFIVSAMGNEFTSGNPTNYPAAYAEVFAVGAVNQFGNRAFFSNSGSHIDVVAPGVDIYGAALRTTGVEYYAQDGTSMAVPFVSGLAALLLSMDNSLTNEQLAEIIQNTATDLGTSGWDEFTGTGRINAQAAVESLLNVDSAPLPTPTMTPTLTPLPTPLPTSSPTPTPPVTGGGSNNGMIYLPFVVE